MTVAISTASSGPYVANAATVAFPFTFRALAANEVAVYADGALVSPSLYTVTLAASGGTVTFTTAPANGVSILIISDPSFLQDAAFQNNGAFLPATIEGAYDRAAVRDISMKARLDKLLTTTMLAASRVGRFLGWDADGNAALLSGTGADSALRTDLAAGGGAALSGFLAAGDDAVASSVQTRLRVLGPSPNGYTNLFTGASVVATASAVSNGGSNYSWVDYNQSSIVLDPGIYTNVATTDATTMANLMLQARQPATVTLNRVGKTDYLYTKSNALRASFVSGFNLWEGKGLLNLTHTGNNVLGYQVFEDLVLMAFTECGLAFAPDDMPYIKVSRSVFRGSDTSISIATGGKYDGCAIADSEFHNGVYGLKHVGTRSGNHAIERCSFFTIRPGVTGPNPSKAADIWFGPSTAFALSGTGTVIRQCKFGNEGMGVGDVRILIADEDTGTGTGVQNHPHSTADSTGFFDGLAILNSRISGIDGLTSPFMKTYTGNMSRGIFDGNWTESPHTRLLQYMNTDAAEDTYASRTNYVRLMPPSPGTMAFQLGVSNRCMGIVEDPFGNTQWDPLTQFGGFSDENGFVSLIAGQGADGTLFHATGVAVASSFAGCPNAQEVTYTASDGLCYADLATVTPGVPSRVDIWLKSGATLPITQARIHLVNTITGKSAVYNPVLLSTTGAGQSIFCVFPIGSPSNWRLQVEPLDYSAGVRTKIQVGDFAVYHGRKPVNVSNIRTQGNGKWNGAHLIMGTTHIWEQAGKLYIKTGGAPTSGTDGAVVGTQS